jgi:ribosomal protein S18 acetylase RimI-like enzyme
MPESWRHPTHYNISVEITIREAQPSEFDVLWRIDQQCFPPGMAYSRAELAAYMRLRGAFTLVAEEAHAGSGQRAIVGYIVARAAARKAGHIVTIDVLSEARRHAVGSRLLRAAEERLQAAGCRNVFLETAVDNLAAIRFYKKFNYFLVRTLPRYYSNGVDALHLVKELPSPAASG